MSIGHSPFAALCSAVLIGTSAGPAQAQAGGARENLDSLCEGTAHVRFWSIGGGSIKEWTLVGNTVTGGNEILQGPLGLGAGALAFCDAMAPSTFHTAARNSLMYAYDNGSWINGAMCGQPVNMGGSGSHLYFTTGADLLYHFDGVNCALIVDPAPLAFACADIAVDGNGLAYMLVGPDYQNTTMIRAYTPAGAIAAEYPFTFYSFNTYGTFWANNTMYIAIGDLNGSTPNTLFPITFDGGIAIMGAGIPFAADGLSDLASCNTSGPIGMADLASTAITPRAFPMPADAFTQVHFKGREYVDVEVLDVLGRTLSVRAQLDETAELLTLCTGELAPGRYQLVLRSTSRTTVVPLLVEHP